MQVNLKLSEPILMRLFLIVVCLVAVPAHADFSDDFGNLDAWDVWDDTNSFDIGLTNDDGVEAPAVLITERMTSRGNQDGGIQKRFDSISSFYLSFDWRAYSRAPRHSHGLFEIVDADTSELLYRRDLIRGGLRDTQWQHFNATDLSHVIHQNGHAGARNIYVRFVLRDAWVNNYEQNFLIDNFELVKSVLRAPTTVPMQRDDLSQGPEPWTFANPVGGCAHAMSMRMDQEEGNQAPSLLVEGTYTYTGNITCRWGMQRTIPVAFPFVLELDWAYSTPDRGNQTRLITIAILATGQERGRVLYTESLNKAEGWQNYRPHDLTNVLLGHETVTVLVYSHASSDVNQPSYLWVDNLAWTQPCETPFALYADPDGDGLGDPTQPHPHGPIFCYDLTGWSSDTGRCEDGPAGRDHDEDGYSLCDGDCDDGDPLRSPADRDQDGFSTCADDCDDLDATRTPADEDEDGLSSCDGDCDDSNAALNLSDADEDGASSCAGDCDDTDPALNIADLDQDGISTCEGDCDDRSWQIAPGLPEIPGDNIDNNCDGEIDEIDETDAPAADAGPPVTTTPDASSCACLSAGMPGLELWLVGLWMFLAVRRRGLS